MQKEDYKNRVIEFIQNGIGHTKNEDEIESFYELIDELEEAAVTDRNLYELIADCYMQLKNPKKAKESFIKFYDPHNKKHLKKLYDYENLKQTPITRPSNRPKRISRFSYVDSKMVRDLFIDHTNTNCSICGLSKPLYIGQAYDKNGKRISYSAAEEKFCMECLKNGRAAEVHKITFQPMIMQAQSEIDEEKRNIVLRQTPACSGEFESYDEDIWPICCGDYCRYKEKKQYGIFIFQCMHCRQMKKLGGAL